jgi:CHAD domain-containing protein
MPVEAGVVWRLCLPRGEWVEAWEPGNGGLAPPAEIARLIESVAAGKQLVPAPPLSDDVGARRLREMIEAQRVALLVHDPGARLGSDAENLHEHRVAARRVRAYLRAARQYLDPASWRSLAGPLADLGQVTGPARDLDVLLERLRDELAGLDEADRLGGETIVARVELERESARHRLLGGLNGDEYRIVLSRLRLPLRMTEGVDAIPLERITRKEVRRLVRAVDRLGKYPDEDALHKLRIALKRTRYAAELAPPTGKAGRSFLAKAKSLQGLLGEHQDAIVAEQKLRALTIVDITTAAAFVAGRIVERQHARRAITPERLPTALKQLRKSATDLR